MIQIHNRYSWPIEVLTVKFEWDIVTRLTMNEWDIKSSSSVFGFSILGSSSPKQLFTVMADYGCDIIYCSFCLCFCVSACCMCHVVFDCPKPKGSKELRHFFWAQMKRENKLRKIHFDYIGFKLSVEIFVWS